MPKHFDFKQFSLASVCSLNVKTVLFQAIQFCLSMQFISVWPIDRTLWGAITPGQSRTGSDSNEEYSNTTGTSPSDCLVPYPGSSLVGVLSVCSEAVCVFYSPNRLGKRKGKMKTKTFHNYKVQYQKLVINWSRWLLAAARKGKGSFNKSIYTYVCMYKI